MKRFIQRNAVKLVMLELGLLLLPAGYIYKLMIMCVIVIIYCTYKAIDTARYIKSNERALMHIRKERAKAQWQKNFMENYPTIE